MTKIKPKNLLKLIPMFLVMAIIFFFSSMEGDDSANTSGLFLKALQIIAKEVTHKGFTEEALANIHLVIRKCAHFTEYAVLGAAIMYGLFYRFRNMKLKLLPPEAIAFLYACTDELHQYFVPGRYGTFGDVIIDSCGAFTGIMIYYLICKKKQFISLI